MKRRPIANCKFAKVLKIFLLLILVLIIFYLDLSKTTLSFTLTISEKQAGIAQLVEQWIENPRVSSSNLDPGILIRYVTIYYLLAI